MNSSLENRLGYSFKDAGLLKLALSHASWGHEQNKRIPHNERLEFWATPFWNWSPVNISFEHLQICRKASSPKSDPIWLIVPRLLKWRNPWNSEMN